MTVSRYLDMILAPGDPTPEADLIPTGLIADMVLSTTMLHDVEDHVVEERWRQIKPVNTVDGAFVGIDGPGSQEPYDPGQK